MSDSTQFFGKYRGTVINNLDPLQIGRIQVQVPDVSTCISSSWAMPCVPVAGQQMGTFAVPPVAANVWVEFEHGDPNYPIWSGCFWLNAADVPSGAGAAAVSNFVFQSPQQNAIIVSDAGGPAGGITLKSPAGATLIVNDTGIYIQNGKGASVVLLGPTVTTTSS